MFANGWITLCNLGLNTKNQLIIGPALQKKTPYDSEKCFVYLQDENCSTNSIVLVLRSWWTLLKGYICINIHTDHTKILNSL